jgi:N-acetyltransferase
MPERDLTLSGHFIDLQLLNTQHTHELCDIVSSDKLCYHQQTFIPTPELMPTYIKLSLDAIEKGKELPFAIMDKKSQKIVGSIKLENLHDEHGEIGSTFIGPHYQGSCINSEAKFILMEHAFESLGLKHIDFIVHKENIASNKAMMNLGIKANSSFSHIKSMPQWENNEYINYIIEVKEWKEVKKNLQNRLFPADFREL